MLDITKVLKRSWHILWNYRTLWIFGLLLAITAASGGGGSGGGSNSGYDAGGNNGNGYDIPNDISPVMTESAQWFEQNIEPLFTPEKMTGTIIWLLVGLFLFVLVIIAITALIRYPSETAVIRMVDEYEQTGTKVGFKQGWKMGWSRAAFRLSLIDLIINLPVFLFIAVLAGLGLTMYFSATGGGGFGSVAGMVASIGCVFLFVFFFIVAMVFLSLLRQFFARAAVLENVGVGKSFRRGWQMFKMNWKSAGLMWLVMLGIGIGYTLAMIFVTLLLIPLLILTVIAGLIVGAIPGLLVGLLVSTFAPQLVAIIVGILVGLPLFGLIAGLPLTVINGWMHIYTSNVWTLTWREFKAMEKLASPSLPELVE